MMRYDAGKGHDNNIWWGTMQEKDKRKVNRSAVKETETCLCPQL